MIDLPPPIPTDFPQNSVVIVMDASQHINEDRLYIYKVNDKQEAVLVKRTKTAHGIGSDRDRDGYIDKFSNKYNTYANSEGVYKIAEKYRGSWSPAYRLDGLDKTNSNARGRAIVLHEADYVTKTRAGYSQGCIVVYRGFVKKTLVPLISTASSAWLIVKNGTLPVKH